MPCRTAPIVAVLLDMASALTVTAPRLAVLLVSESEPATLVLVVSETLTPAPLDRLTQSGAPLLTSVAVPVSPWEILMR